MIVSAGLTKAFGNPDAKPNDPLGVDLARIGLGGPSRPMLVGATPCPSALVKGPNWLAGVNSLLKNFYKHTRASG